ncbi:unnamed protein product [Ilex paraguariensis]|uniref:C2H2-type domain-containing protein n=1 Tax=Ilex paraguariensis TaxID=185542 RepID=A0ABC8UW54_9AQUA
MQAFSLDFNLRSHMNTHSQENYHICPFPECGKRYAHEYKLKNHVMTHREKRSHPELQNLLQWLMALHYACPHDGCEKAYIHEYKLNLHLRREHPDHFPDENAKNAQSNVANEMDETIDEDAYVGKRGNGKIQKQSRPKPNLKLPPSKVAKRKGSSASPASVNIVVKKPWPVKEEIYEEEDSEETEEDRDNAENGWRYRGNNEEDDEETEDED